jgi:hypothetical protein
MLASPLRTPLIRTGKYGKRGQVDVGGLKSSADHEGVDARAAVGTPVYPTIGGTVVQTITGWTSEASVGVSRGRRIFTPGMTGNTVVIRGDDGRDHVHAHNQSVSTIVGRRVETSTQIARSGRSGGNRMAAHIHYGIWLEYAPSRWRSIDPTPLLPWDGDVFGELTSKANNPLEEDTMNDDDRKWMQKALNDTEGRIRADMKANVADQVAKALAAAEGARDALTKPIDGFAPIDVIRTHAVATLKAVREQAASQGIDLDEQALADSVLDALGEAIVNRA